MHMNRRTVVRAACALAIAGAGSLAFAQVGMAAGPSATAHTPQVRWVHAGQSVQAAIDASRPGDTVRVASGTYAEQLHISTDGIRLIGSGPHTVITAPAHPVAVPEPATGQPGADGITVGTATASVARVEISDLQVTGYSGAGVALHRTVDARVEGVKAARDAYDGILVDASTRTTVTHDRVSGAAHGGIEVFRSKDSRAVIEHDTVTGNHRGILVLSSTGGTISRDVVEGNGTGVLLVTLDPALRTSGWQVTHNQVIDNTAATTPPSISGTGIALTGANHITIADNLIKGNRPTGASPISGGVVFLAYNGKGKVTPPIPSTANTVHDNTITGNAPFDIARDAMSEGNTVTHNAGHPTLGLLTPPAHH